MFALAATAQDEPTVDCTGLGQTVLVRGRLGQTLGKVITIEGRDVGRDYQRPKGEQNDHLFRVTKVEGQALPEPRIIRLDFFRFRSVRPPGEGEQRTLRGYEDGGFTGIPAAALKETKTMPQTTSWHFTTFFQVMK